MYNLHIKGLDLDKHSEFLLWNPYLMSGWTNRLQELHHGVPFLRNILVNLFKQKNTPIFWILQSPSENIAKKKNASLEPA